MRRWVVDIETSPNLAVVWGIWQQNVSLSQLLESTRMLCFAAKEIGSGEEVFASEFHHGTDAMIEAAWDIMNDADAIIGWNSQGFDVKHLNREFITHGYVPPSPFKNIDLMQTVKRQFKFPSNKLEYCAQTLLGHGKMETGGMELWLDCLAGKRAAWNKMRKYNIMDVDVTAEMYEALLPWIPNHPNWAMFIDEDERMCGNCASTNVHKRGIARTNMFRYQRYQCQDCGSWHRGRHNIDSKEKKQALIARVN